jgi:hypothetical protein
MYPSLPFEDSYPQLRLHGSRHFIVAHAPYLHKSKTVHPLQATPPNGPVIAAMHTATLDLPCLPMIARQAHILLGLAQY